MTGNGKGVKGGKGLWGPNKSNGSKRQVQIVMGEYTSEVPSGIVMVVACGGTVQNKKGIKIRQRRVRGNPACVGRNRHQNTSCVEVITVYMATLSGQRCMALWKKREMCSLDPTAHIVRYPA